jgi:quercetin dioxygenase-like cupin family protein
MTQSNAAQSTSFPIAIRTHNSPLPGPRVKPGITTRWHSLSATDERYVILSGQGMVEIGNLPAHSVQAGDVVLIPQNCR